MKVNNYGLAVKLSEYLIPKDLVSICEYYSRLCNYFVDEHNMLLTDTNGNHLSANKVMNPAELKRFLSSAINLINCSSPIICEIQFLLSTTVYLTTLRLPRNGGPRIGL